MKILFVKCPKCGKKMEWLFDFTEGRESKIIKMAMYRCFDPQHMPFYKSVEKKE